MSTIQKSWPLLAPTNIPSDFPHILPFTPKPLRIDVLKGFTPLPQKSFFRTH